MTTISHQLINAARAQASKDGSRLIVTLQQQSGLIDAEFVAQLAEQFHCPVLAMEQLNALQPAFDVVSYHEAVKRGCMVVVMMQAMRYFCLQTLSMQVCVPGLKM